MVQWCDGLLQHPSVQANTHTTTQLQIHRHAFLTQNNDTEEMVNTRRQFLAMVAMLERAGVRATSRGRIHDLDLLLGDSAVQSMLEPMSPEVIVLSAESDEYEDMEVVDSYSPAPAVVENAVEENAELLHNVDFDEPMIDQAEVDELLRDVNLSDDDWDVVVDGRYLCPNCPRGFRSNELLVAHSLTHVERTEEMYRVGAISLTRCPIVAMNGLARDCVEEC